MGLIDQSEANYCQADILIKNTKNQEAMPRLKITFAVNPQYMIGYFQLGKCYTDQGKFRDALNVLSKAAELVPDNKSPHYQLAQIYGRLDQPAKKQAEMDIFRKLYNQERAQKLSKEQKSL